MDLNAADPVSMSLMPARMQAQELSQCHGLHGALAGKQCKAMAQTSQIRHDFRKLFPPLISRIYKHRQDLSRFL